MHRRSAAKKLGRGDRKVQIEETITMESRNETEGEPSASHQRRCGAASPGHPAGSLLNELFTNARIGYGNGPYNAGEAASYNSSPLEAPEPSRRRSQSNPRSSHPQLGTLSATTPSSDNSPPESLLVSSPPHSPPRPLRTWQRFLVNLIAGRRRPHQLAPTLPTHGQPSHQNCQQQTSTNPTVLSSPPRSAPIDIPNPRTIPRAHPLRPTRLAPSRPITIGTHCLAIDDDKQILLSRENRLLPHKTHQIVRPLPLAITQDICAMREHQFEPHPYGGVGYVAPASPSTRAERIVVGFGGSSTARTRPKSAEWEVGSEKQREEVDRRRGMAVFERRGSPWRSFWEVEAGKGKMFGERGGGGG